MTVCRLTDLSSIFTYQGEETCAADGMCQVKCPVKINTGELIKHIRHENLGGQQTRAQKTAMVRARPCSPPRRSACTHGGHGRQFVRIQSREHSKRKSLGSRTDPMHSVLPRRGMR